MAEEDTIPLAKIHRASSVLPESHAGVVGLNGVKAQKSVVRIAIDAPEKLSGWLVRHRRKGFIKTCDKKWYDFDDDKCKLLVFNGQNDQVPVESIDIARNALTVDMEMSDKPAVFTLSCDGQTINLEAFSSDEMRRWIQQLQKRRELFVRTRAIDVVTRGPSASVVKATKRSSSAGSIPVHVEQYDNKTSNDYSAIREAAAVAGAESNLLVSFDDILTPQSLEFNTLGANARDKLSLNIPPPVLSADPSQFVGKRQERSPINAFRNIFAHTGDRNQQKFEKALEDRLLVMKDELYITKDELTAQKEIVRLLRRQLDFATKEKEALRTLVGNADKDEGQLQILRDRCRHILELEESLQSSRSEKESLHQRNQILKSELMEMARQVALLCDDVRTKEHAILLLNEQLTTMETTGQRDHRTPSQRSVTDAEEQLVRMKDMLDAYKEKLAFLNEEIVSQNGLRFVMGAREETLMAALGEWEAKYARLESRHLFSLKEIAAETRKRPVGMPLTDEERMRIRIMEDALGGSEEDSHEKSLAECDRYGFFISRLHYTNEEFLERKALEADRRHRITMMKKDISHMEHLHRWEAFLMKQTRLIQKSEELKNLMRIGCPDEHRARVWRSCIEWRVSSVKTVKGPKYYQSLVRDSSLPMASAAAKQIKIDLCRTLPNNIHFMNMESDQIPKLEEVLVAFSRHNPAVGYCQGMNRLVAVALLFLNEEDAFWCVTAVVDYLLPGYFSINMAEAQVDQRIFKDLFMEKLPKLYNHLSSILDPTLYSFNWFLTVFVDNMHPETFLPIWDAFLVEGKKILFRFSLAMFKYFEDTLMELTDQTVANRFLRTLGDRVTDLRKLQTIAYEGLNPFPMKLLRTRRAIHLPEILSEMQQLERLRASLPQENKSPADEDDD